MVVNDADVKIFECNIYIPSHLITDAMNIVVFVVVVRCATTSTTTTVVAVATEAAASVSHQIVLFTTKCKYMKKSTFDIKMKQTNKQHDHIHTRNSSCTSHSKAHKNKHATYVTYHTHAK